jgi:squalene-hopene/tetraprenyl-beta-curcumene cyclase
VARKAVGFLQSSVRSDGSWPIDSDLSTWLTTQAVSALNAAGDLDLLNGEATRRWLLARQYRELHPYTDSPPGGWAWTHLSGGVPDADDTSGALLALAYLKGGGDSPGAEAGVNWLLGLQNGDGGWPTFCRGWGRLPFDRSAPDLTAHALRALGAWSGRLGRGDIARAVERGFRYLSHSQRTDGAWVPLWFGNQEEAAQENPVYGTSRVLLAYRDAGKTDTYEVEAGVRYLVGAQNDDGGWGGAAGVESSVEETALSLEALSLWWDTPGARAACRRGALYLTERVADGGLDRPKPIGVYFAKLWYAERLYPIIWSVGALGSVLARMAHPGARAGISSTSEGE